MRKLYNRVFSGLIACMLIMSASSAFAQTVLVNPTAEGGFELGSTFAANGWTMSSSANNPWVVGTAVATAPITGNSAYVSLDAGATVSYNIANPCVNYFYRDITVPAGESVITLTFNWSQQGENSWDIWQVFVAPTSITPVGQNTHPGSGTNNVPASIAGATYVGNGSLVAGVQTATLYLPANLAGTTFRLIFAWKSDTSVGTQPPAAIDNISLTSRVPGTFISIVTGNWSAPSTWQANAVPTPGDSAVISTGHVVTIDQVGQGINNMLIDGNLTFGTTPTTFNVLGNLWVSPTGLFNVFNGTTGKTLTVAKNISNNGSIDISVGTTTAGNLTLNGTSVQSVTGTGTFGATNVIRNLTCSNTSTAIPNINWNINNVKVAYNLNLTGARVNLGTNKMTFGNGAQPNTLTAPAGTGFLPGAKFSRFWNTTTLGSTITAGSTPTSTVGLYPFVNPTGQSRNAFVRRSTATGSVAGELAVVYTDGTGVTSGLAINDAGYNVTTRFNGNWTFSTEATAMSSPDYILALVGQGAITLTGTLTNPRIVYASTLLPGTHQNGNNTVCAQRSTLTQAGLLAEPLYIGIGSIDYVPATPGTITQSVGIPTCTGGTQLTATGTPETDVTWYWQTSATGTDMTTAYSGPYTVFANGTYYLRGFNAVSNQWSTTSSSITVSNFTTAPAPPTPTALANPACAPGTTISMPAAPVGIEYYWQGTVVNGSSQANPATAPFNITSTGTYTVAAYETATQCWSNTVSLAVTVDNIIPNNPTIGAPILNICTNATTGQVTAVTTSNVPGTLATTQAGGNGCTHGNMFNLTAGTGNIIVNSLDITPNLTGAQNVLVYYKVGTYIGSETNTAAWTLVGTYPITGTSGAPINIDVADFTIPAGQVYGVYVDYSAQYSNIAVGTTYSNADLTLTVGTGSCTAWAAPINGRAFNGTIHYTKNMNSSATWFDAASGGNVVGTGSPFETVGTSVLANPAPTGNYWFYVASTLGGCYSAQRDSVLVSVAPVLAQLNPVDVTCNALNNGSFTLGTVSCGTAPFMYSVNGGTFSSTIPTNLVAGTYTVIVQDAGMQLSGPILVNIQEPSAPQNLSASNVTFFQGNLSWTPQGNETSWVVEYGPAGFTPGTGTIINATNDTVNVWGLTENTSYDFYVQAGCVTTSAWAGPYTFATDPGFLAWDNQCPPAGFVDISGTGTDLNLTDDSETGITLPFTFPYQGAGITDLTVGNNGGIQLGTLTGNVGYGGNMTTIVGNYLFAWGDDMDDETGNVYYQVQGTSPNQVAIFQWNDQNNFSNGPGMVTFQIQMYENGEIYYVYDDVLFGGTETADDYAGNADIGLSGTMTDINVSNNSQSYLQNNSCVHFYYALCPNVQNMVTLTYTEDAQLNWDPGMYGETNWTVVYGLEGFDPAVAGQAIDTFYLTTSDMNFGGTLTQLTCYDVYIYSECQADSLTSDGFLVNFCTKPYCADITGLAGQTDPDSLELTWNWVESSPAYPVTGFNVQYGMTGFQLGSGTIATANGIDFSDTIVDANLMGSGVYQVYVQAECSGTNDTSNWVGPITLVMTPTNDIVCSQEALQLNTQYTFNTTNSTVSLNEVNIAPPATGAQTTDGWANSTLNGTLWYTFVAPASGQVRINSTSNDFNTQSALYTATNCGDFNTFTLVAANDDAIGGGSVSPNYTVCGLTPGNTYYLMYDKFNATNGNFGVYISEIVMNAGNANALDSLCYGNTVNLFTTINGNPNGGTWSSSIPSVNASINDSIFNSLGLAYTTFDFEYRVVDGCAYDSVISQIRVFGPSNAGQDGTITACRNQPINLLHGLNGNADLNGTWYDPSNNALASGDITTANFPGQYNYDYISGNGVCPDDTANVVVTVTNCNFLSLEETVFEGVAVYPNPTTGVVFIEAAFANGAFNAQVTDVNGRVIAIKNASITAQNNTINLTGVERGTYFIKLSKDNVEKVFRIVVQ